MWYTVFQLRGKCRRTFSSRFRPPTVTPTPSPFFRKNIILKGLHAKARVRISFYGSYGSKWIREEEREANAQPGLAVPRILNPVGLPRSKGVRAIYQAPKNRQKAATAAARPIQSDEEVRFSQS